MIDDFSHSQKYVMTTEEMDIFAFLQAAYDSPIKLRYTESPVTSILESKLRYVVPEDITLEKKLVTCLGFLSVRDTRMYKTDRALRIMAKHEFDVYSLVEYDTKLFVLPSDVLFGFTTQLINPN